LLHNVNNNKTISLNAENTQDKGAHNLFKKNIYLCKNCLNT